jgi:AbrB family looped-hinge helix DNA binding protein
MAEIKSKRRVIPPPRRGQITIPAEFRRELGIGPDTALEVILGDDELRIKRVEAPQADDEPTWFERLYDYFAPAREEAVAKGYTEEEINEWIDEAVREVRAERAARARQG